MKYKFNQDIKTALKPFEECLKLKGYNANTIKQKSNYAGCFLSWLESERMEATEARYNDMLNFIDYCNLQALSKKHINTILLAIRNFYEYLKLTNPGINNPAINLRIKGETRRTVNNIINYNKLKNLYNSFNAETTRDKRNKAILGLLIYQGITTEELHQLETHHLKLGKGEIFIPGSRKRNSRTLELKPFQILELHEYLTKIRTRLIAEINKPKPTRKPNEINQERIQTQLFISTNGSENLKSSLLHMFRNIKNENPLISSAKRIRTSVIIHWLKSYNLRQVQYMAGHKYVSSTERYQANNLEGLKNSLDKYHPIK